jgi:murein DD-endopeptidase MepM/ murein hydrolase activator NlpD
MRGVLSLACALACLVAAAPAAGQGTGGTPAPSSGGGLTYGQPVQEVRPSSPNSFMRPVATEFGVMPGILDDGTAATFTYRVDGPRKTVRVRILLTPAGASRPAVRLRLGRVPTGVRRTYVWAPAIGQLAAGQYAVTLRAIDRAGRVLRRTAKASGRTGVTVQVAPPPLQVGAGLFPVQGPYSFGQEDARFGAKRSGHIHQGQDVIAASGTPLVAPVAGFAYWVAFQRKGAGHYVVLRAVDGNDYVFMHLQAGSVSVVKGATLVAGQAFGRVGNTGASSGPHLHFEIWPDGWYSSKASLPVDPLPQLQAWAATR